MSSQHALRQLKAVGKWGARKLGVDVRSVRHTEGGILRQLLERLRPAVVLDVGANVGQYARLVRSLGYEGLIVSFEALEPAHLKLAAAARADRRWVVAPCAALSSHAGSGLINVASNSVSSSLLPLTPLLRQAAPQADYVGRQVTRIMRLDSYAELPTAGELYLKMDTQGSEMEILQGAAGLLPRVCAIQVELSLAPLYAGAPLMNEMIRRLDELGYELFQLVPGFSDVRDGRLLQAEGFFRRRNP